jgi:hypothetical protein
MMILFCGLANDGQTGFEKIVSRIKTHLRQKRRRRPLLHLLIRILHLSLLNPAAGGFRAAIKAEANDPKDSPSDPVAPEKDSMRRGGKQPPIRLDSRCFAARALDFAGRAGEALIAVGLARVVNVEDVVADAGGDDFVAGQFRGSQKGFQYGLLLAHDSLS